MKTLLRRLYGAANRLNYVVKANSPEFLGFGTAKAQVSIGLAMFLGMQIWLVQAHLGVLLRP